MFARGGSVKRFQRSNELDSMLYKNETLVQITFPASSDRLRQRQENQHKPSDPNVRTQKHPEEQFVDTPGELPPLLRGLLSFRDVAVSVVPRDDALQRRHDIVRSSLPVSSGEKRWLPVDGVWLVGNTRHVTPVDVTIARRHRACEFAFELHHERVRREGFDGVVRPRRFPGRRTRVRRPRGPAVASALEGIAEPLRRPDVRGAAVV